MRTTIIFAALGFALPALFAPAANAQQAPVFLCAAPAGHVCQFVVQTAAAPSNYALPTGGRTEIPGVAGYAAK